MSFCILFQSGFGVSKAIYIISSKLKKLSLLEIFHTIFSTCLFLYLINSYGSVGFVVGLPLTALIKNILFTYYTNKIWPPNLPLENNFKSEHMHLSFHSILRNIFSNISTQADVIVLGLLNTKEAVAIYKVAKTLSGIPIRVSYPIWAALRPKIIKALRNGDYQTLQGRLLHISLTFLALTIPLIIVAFYTFKPFVLRSYGESYLIAFYPFLILLIGSWMYNSVTGWMSFFLIISPLKALMTCFTGLFAFFVVFVSLAFHKDLVALSFGLSLVAITMSILSWIFFLKHKKDSLRNFSS